MAYDIPDEIKYREKIVANLDAKQLLYAIVFGIIALFSFRTPLEGDLKFILPTSFSIIGIGFIFFGLEEKLRDILAFHTGLKKATHNSKRAQNFFGVKEIRDDLVYLDDGSALAVIEIQPINFVFLDDGRKKAVIANFKAFLNQLTAPIQILVRSGPVSLDNYFDRIESSISKNRRLFLELYSDFRVFVEDYLDTNQAMERRFYVVLSMPPHKESSPAHLEELVTISLDRLSSCSLDSRRLSDNELSELFRSYSDSGAAESEGTPDKEDESNNDFRNLLTPSFEIRQNHAIVNGEAHRIIRVSGYPKEVEEGWLYPFLSRNERYDISIHISPSSINSMLVYLHNQIIQQTGDLLASTAKGTPNPSLEIKKADTMRVYEALYKGKEKLFGVSLYLDVRAADAQGLSLLSEKCKSHLNAHLMVPKMIEWRIADGIKSVLPLAKDALNRKRDFLTDSLAATFPFISPVGTKRKGILFANDTETLNPIFIDFDSMSNKHFFVIGISGSGKSYTSKYLIMQQLFREDTNIFILDPNGEYSGLCQKLDGQVIELSRDSETAINLFDLSGQDFGGKMLSLISAFDIIVGGLTESQKGVLNRALLKAYRKKGIEHDNPETWNKEAPTFSDLRAALHELRNEAGGKRDFLQDPSIEALLNRVEMYCKGGVFGFLDRPSCLSLNKGVISFDLSRLPNAVKTLMMFSTLEHINNEIRKDKKPKVVLIDEGWSLLRSREAAGYILDFVKTSRKFNASIGFITQEIDDLLRSRAGRSILNTASVKILMRQNPTNIDLISSTLKLNEQAKNYLLTAPSGFGLIITEHDAHKFFVRASEKLHEIITTHPNEAPRTPIQPQKKAKPKIDLGRGLYQKENLAEEEVAYLIENGYALHKDRLGQFGGSAWHLVKRRNNESPKHAFFCWTVFYMLKERFKKVDMKTSKPGDVIVSIGKIQIAFEIETGENFKYYKPEELSAKFEAVRTQFQDFYIIVTDWRDRRKYEKFGKTITRNELPSIISKLGRL
jgi:hypothetical protein